ncbi:MAG: nuclear transport factor 2 family protein [Ignavibacteriae bacterium]|nr:nuclear transport factor 2 family protein [Ignavibacteriota bacterium]
MKYTFVSLCLAVLMTGLLACDSAKQQQEEQQMMAVQQESAVKNLITNLHSDLKRVYGGAADDVDTMIATYYVPDMYYVTPWGTSETLDSTVLRLKAAIPRVQNYENSVQNLTVSVYGDGAYAFYVLRQNYSIDGFELEEYLPTTAILEHIDGSWKIVHLQRTTDYETMQQYVALQQRTAKQTSQRK